MSFEAYAQSFANASAPRGRSTRRITYVVSVAIHIAAALGAVAYSFWHVEEVTPSTVTVTFISAAALPPPPPPPLPLGGGASASAAKKHVSVRPKVVPTPDTKVPDVVQPKAPDEKPKPVEVKPETKVETKGAPDAPAGVGTPDGVKGGVAGGVKGGVVGGVVGGTPGGTGVVPAAVAAKFLPPQMGAQQKLSGQDPDFPPMLRTAGAKFQVKAKVCVSTAGTVDTVLIMKHAHPSLDSNVVGAVKAWRFRPLLANGTPVPFCYFANFDFSSD